MQSPPCPLLRLAGERNLGTVLIAPQRQAVRVLLERTATALARHANETAAGVHCHIPDQTAFREALFLGLQDGDRRPRTRDRGADRLRLSNLPRHVVCRHPYMPAPPPIMSTREQADETPPAMSRIAIIGKHARKQWEWLLYRARLKLGLKLGLNPQLVSILPRHVWANCGTCAIVHHKVRVRLTSPHHNTGF